MKLDIITPQQYEIIKDKLEEREIKIGVIKAQLEELENLIIGFIKNRITKEEFVRRFEQYLDLKNM